MDTARAYASDRMEARDRHLKLLTETIEAVNSTLDLQEVLSQVATNVASALEADACFVYLYDATADELVLRATHGTHRRADAATAHAPGRRDHRIGRCGRRAGDGRGAGASRPALQELPEPARGRVRVDPRGTDPHAARLAGGCAQRTHPGAAVVLGGRGRAAAGNRRPGGSVDRAREALCRGAASRRRARGARPDLGGCLELALPGGVARGDRLHHDGCAGRDGRRAGARRRADRLARGPRRRARDPAAAPLARPADRRARRRPGFAVQRGRRRAAGVDRDARGGRARTWARGDARRARARDPPQGEEQPADGGLATQAAGALGRSRSTRARRSSTPSTGSSRSPRCTSC